jgi:hypothetical protein
MCSNGDVTGVFCAMVFFRKKAAAFTDLCSNGLISEEKAAKRGSGSFEGLWRMMNG